MAFELVNVRWSAAPTVTEKLEMSLARPVFEAVMVTALALWPVTSSEAMPPAAVAVPRPVTVPAPAVLAKLTTVVLSPVSRLPAASRTSTVSVLVDPDATLAVSLVNVRRSATPTVTEKLEPSLVSPVFDAVMVSAPAVWPVASSEAMPPEAVAVPRPLTVPAPAVLAKLTTVVLSPVSRLPAASRTSTVSVFVEPDATFDVPLVKLR